MTSTVAAEPEQARAIGERIRQTRAAKGWTIERLAREMGVHWRTVQRWQAGDLPRLGTLLEVADVLEIPRDLLVDTDDTLADRVARLEAELAELRERLDRLER